MSYSTPGHPVIVVEPYSINCTSSIVENVLGDNNPSVKWMDPEGREISTDASDVHIGGMTVTSQGASLELAFDRFGTTLAGKYTCQGCIEVPKASISNNCATIIADITLGVSCE